MAVDGWAVTFGLRWIKTVIYIVCVITFSNRVQVCLQQKCNTIAHLSWWVFPPYLVKRNACQFVRNRSPSTTQDVHRWVWFRLMRSSISCYQHDWRRALGGQRSAWCYEVRNRITAAQRSRAHVAYRGLARCPTGKCTRNLAIANKSRVSCARRVTTVSRSQKWPSKVTHRLVVWSGTIR